jgi:hypothetical protein
VHILLSDRGPRISASSPAVALLNAGSSLLTARPMLFPCRRRINDPSSKRIDQAYVYRRDPADCKHVIDVRWTQSATAGVTSNRIYRRLSDGATPSPLLVTLGATTSYSDTTTSRHTTYWYQVTAISNGIESPRSPEVCATAR